MKKIIDIYTDGSCLGNGNIDAPGGWGAVLIYKTNIKKVSGPIESTTNNRAELLAVINALNILKESCIITIYTLSKLLDFNCWSTSQCKECKSSFMRLFIN